MGKPRKVWDTVPNPIWEAVELIGSYERMGEVCGVTGKAVMKWARQGYLPRTDWTGETNYAGAIARATSYRIKRQALLSARPRRNRLETPHAHER
jgi:hypothetical protein